MFGALAIVAVAGCFDPRLDDVSCETTGRCPGGLVCDGSLCVRGPSGEVCGDGVRGAGERCDDGNTGGGDGCSADCSTASCTAPITHPTVQALVDDPACAVGYVAAGRYFERVVIDRDLALIGVGFGDRAIDGGGVGRPVEVNAGREVVLRGLTVRNGLAVAGGGIRNDGRLTLESVTVTANLATGDDAAGGGIWHRQGRLVIRGSVIAGNRVEASGGGGVQIGGGGGVLAQAPLEVRDGSRIEGNVVEVAGPDTLARGGGIDARGAAVILDGCAVSANLTEALAAPPALSTAARGGAIAADAGASIEIAGCVVEGNRLFASGPTEILDARGGAIFVDGGAVSLRAAVVRDNAIALSGPGATSRGAGAGLFAAGSPVSVRGSTLATNEIAAAGQRPSDGVALEGGGAVIELGSGVADVALVNATIAGNRGAGLVIRDLGASAGSARLLNLTIAGNVAGLVIDQPAGAAASITLASSIAAANDASDCAATAPVLRGDYNLVGAGCDFAGDPQHNLIGVDPQLLPLGDNGGATPTLLPQPQSPAIDAGAEPACLDADGSALGHDQRGLARPAGARCDIGAVERRATAGRARSAAPPNRAASTRFRGTRSPAWSRPPDRPSACRRRPAA